MKSLSWRGLTEAIGVAAIVASLLFVGFQLRQDAQIARAEVLGAYAAANMEMRQAHYPYVDLIMKSNHGEELSEAEKYILDNMVFNLMQNMVFLNIRSQQIGEIGSGTNELLFAAHLYENPGLRAAFERNHSRMRTYVDPFRTPESLARTNETGSGAFRDRIKSNLARLDDMDKE